MWETNLLNDLSRPVYTPAFCGGVTISYSYYDIQIIMKERNSVRTRDLQGDSFLSQHKKSPGNTVLTLPKALSMYVSRIRHS